MEKEIGKIKVKHRNIIQKHLDEIKQLQSPILQRLYALNEVEESKEVSATISYSCENETFSKQPPKRMYQCEISFQNKEIKKISSYQLESSVHYLPHWRRESSKLRNHTFQLEKCWMSLWYSKQSKLDIKVWVVSSVLMKNKYG